MSVITMCVAESCKLSKDCLRHEDSGTKPTPYWQPMFDFSEGLSDEHREETCIFFCKK